MGNAAAIGREIRAEVSRVLRDVMVEAAYALTDATPKDTHHASNNWILSVRRPYDGIAGDPDAPSTMVQAQAVASLASYDVARDGPIYLRNNVEYVQFLDQGSSPQAAAGWVANAMMSAVSKAPRGRKGAVRKMLRGMARKAYRKGL
jgi:hypothetical protein